MTKMSWERKAIWAKPCPFCGSKKVVTETRDHFYGQVNKTCTYIECMECGARVYGKPIFDDECKLVSNDYNAVQHQVLKLWNRRMA